MPEYPKTKTQRDCDVCGVTHDEAIHEATVRVHEWFRSQVRQYFQEAAESETQVA